MEVVGVLLFIWVFGAICNFIKKVQEAKVRIAAEKGKESHLSMALRSTKGLGGNP